MTATLITPDEVLEHERNADFRLSARQRDMLRTLNMLFDELTPARMETEAVLDISESHLEAGDVSRIVRV